METKPCFPNFRLGVIGGGVMAKSVLFPLFDRGLLKPKNVIVAGNTQKTLAAWSERGCTITVFAENGGKIFQEVDVVLWAVKPQMFPKVLGFANKASQDQLNEPLHLSVMLGITLAQFSQMLVAARGVLRLRTIRTMPNIGHRVGSGCTVFALGPDTPDADRIYVEALFSPTGIVTEVPEAQINGFGALAGSGVGFLCPVLEAMSDGGVKVGLGREISLKMAAQTMKATAELFLQEGTHPAVLKDNVCSPGGSTIAGIAELERGGLRSSIISAIDAANQRSAELGKLA